MSWKTFHRRSEVLRRVIQEANRRCDGALPTEVPGVHERFADPSDLLAALQLRWYNHLSGAIELELSRCPAHLEEAVVRAWCRAADDLPGVRMILDADLASGSTPVVVRQKEWELLAASARRATATTRGMVAAGRRIENHARRRLGSSAEAHTPGDSTGSANSGLLRVTGW